MHYIQILQLYGGNTYNLSSFINVLYIFWNLSNFLLFTKF